MKKIVTRTANKPRSITYFYNCRLAYVVPDAKNKLRACNHCRLIKS